MGKDGWPGLGERGVQPKRTPGDETIRLSRIGDELVIATVSGDEKQETTGYIRVSLYNAFSLMGLLSLFLGVKLSKKDAKGIML